MCVDVVTVVDVTKSIFVSQLTEEWVAPSPVTRTGARGANSGYRTITISYWTDFLTLARNLI